MAIETKETEKQEVETTLAQLRPLYRELSGMAAAASSLGPKLRAFETHLCTLLNWEEGYSRRMKAMEAELSRTEQAARTRLSTIEHGHKTLIDDLSRKQIEADKAKADAVALERKLIEERGNLALLRDEYQRKIAELNAAHPKKAK